MWDGEGVRPITDLHRRAIADLSAKDDSRHCVAFAYRPIYRMASRKKVRAWCVVRACPLVCMLLRLVFAHIRAYIVACAPSRF